MIVVLDDCGGCSEKPALRLTDFDGWRAGSVVIVGPASSREAELGPSVAKRAIVVSDRVSSWDRTSIGYQLGPFFSPRAYLMAEGWVVLASQRSDESLEQFVERIRSEAGGGRS